MGRKPDFLIIGAMKCGTTSLHDYLAKHPDIYMSNPKELHFFHKQSITESEFEAYKDHFNTDLSICGATPQNYTKRHNKYYNGIPKRIYRFMPDVKLIYIIRDPLDRIKSHIQENYYNEPLDDLEYNIKSGHFAKTSMYYYQISEYFKYFQKDQILILSLEELVEKKMEVLNGLFNFLGVSEMDDESIFNFKSNIKEDKIFPYRIKQSLIFRILNSYFEPILKVVGNKKIFKEILFKKRLNKLFEEIKQDKYKLDLLDDINQLEMLTGRDLNKWKAHLNNS